MKAELTNLPREFETGGERIKDFGKVRLDSGDMIAVATASGRECDVTATPWGLYLAPSLNGRLKAQGFRVALVSNSQGKLFLNAVEKDRMELFHRYLAEQGSAVVQWLDGGTRPVAAETKHVSVPRGGTAGGDSMVQTTGGETLYEVVFGETFALYSKAEFLEFIEPFRVRFERNGLSTDIFKGKRCLDAGCGNGRGSLFMLSNGAEHVECLDISTKNIETTTRFLTEFGYSNFAAQHSSLENIPFEDGRFDFVWCNGVIMHTNSPNRCLAELSRVLKTNGQCWLYIYGSGGVYWRIIQHIRALVRHIPAQACIEVLKLLRYETRYVAEFIDDWYASHLRTYTAADLDRRLAELGFEDRQPLKFGMDYDTSHRAHTFGDRVLMGEGDLRYLLRKADRDPRSDCPVPEDEYGSEYDWPDTITGAIDPAFQDCAKLCSSDTLKIAFCAHLQRELRLLLTRESPFALEDVLALLEKLENILGGLKGLAG